MGTLLKHWACEECSKKHNEETGWRVLHQGGGYSLLKKMTDAHSGTDIIMCPECFGNKFITPSIKDEVGTKYACCSFSNFLGGEEVKKKCQEYASHPKGFLVLLGDAGRGKTHLAIASLRAYILRRGFHNSRFRPFHRILNELRTAEDFERATEIKCGYATWYDFLVIDDVGLDKTTDWGKGIFSEIIYERDANQLATIITSNLALVGVANTFGERVASRLGEGLVIKLEGQDYRLKRKKDRY